MIGGQSGEVKYLGTTVTLTNMLTKKFKFRLNLRKNTLFKTYVSGYMNLEFNHLKTKRKLFYLKTSLYRAVKAFNVGYKNQSVYVI